MAKRKTYMQRKKHRSIEQHRSSRNRPIQIKSFDKNVKAIQWRKENFFPCNKWYWNNWRSLWTKNGPWPLPHTTHKVPALSSHSLARCGSLTQRRKQWAQPAVGHEEWSEWRWQLNQALQVYDYGNPLQYSCLKSPMDRGARRATVQRVTKSWTRLSDLAWPVSRAPRTVLGM